MPSGQRVVVTKGTPVSAAKEVASFLSWVLGYKGVDLAFRHPLLHCLEATNVKFKGICSYTSLCGIHFFVCHRLVFSPCLSRWKEVN